MSTLQHVGAAAPGPVTPTSDNAPWQARVEGNGEADSPDCAHQTERRKRVAKLTARAALLGLVAQELHDSACILVGEAGHPARLPSLQAAEALVAGVELVRAEIAALAGSLASAGRSA